MTILDVLKYSDIDIEDKTELSQLPGIVFQKWKTRISDYILKQAETIAHLDSTEAAQKIISAINAYNSGNISEAQLIAIADPSGIP